MFFKYQSAIILIPSLNFTFGLYPKDFNFEKIFDDDDDDGDDDRIFQNAQKI